MNVTREIEAANRRIQTQIDASVREALMRIGVDVEADERAAREAIAAELAARDAERQSRADAAAEQLGRNLRAINDSFVRLAEGIARGFNGGVR